MGYTKYKKLHNRIANWIHPPKGVFSYFQAKYSFDPFDIRHIYGYENNYNTKHSCLKRVTSSSCRIYFKRPQVFNIIFLQFWYTFCWKTKYLSTFFYISRRSRSTMLSDLTQQYFLSWSKSNPPLGDFDFSVVYFFSRTCAEIVDLS